MTSSRVKFAVVREDPEVEAELVRRTGARALLTVASGGCTALTLCKQFPDLEVTAFDLSPAQLEHVRRKVAAVCTGDEEELSRLNQCGEFEALFRGLRQLTEDLGGRGTKYWPVAFDIFFSDSLLHAMFGKEATQHAESGSYPRYFQRAFERGLDREDAKTNPFLEHVFRGRASARPAYWGLTEPRLELVLGSLEAVPALERFQVYSLSNIFDWSGDALVRGWATLLREKAPRGAAVIVRQLNNRRDVRPFFEPEFVFDDALGRELLARDRSLFYERILVALKR
jgi:S-adenosylmethionine-diacylglycerol 3-amino-3-carboxypropyl transferase